MARCAVFAFLLLAGLLAAVPALAQDPAHAVITLERTTCFGTCPAYTLRITSDGGVDYEGKQFVRITGHAHATIPAEDIARLVDAFEKIGYFSLEDSYRFVVNADGSRSFVTDLPTTTTSIQLGNRHKKIVDYVGAPAALRDLERRIDAVAGAMRWVSVTPDVVIELQRNGWSASEADGASFLRNAVARGDVGTVEALLRAGADPNHGVVPPLFSARDPGVIALLVKWGGDVNNGGFNNETPLIWAVRSGDASRVQALLQAGARVESTSADGKTAMQLAIFLQAHPPTRFSYSLDPEVPELSEIIALLRAAGAK